MCMRMIAVLATTLLWAQGAFAQSAAVSGTVQKIVIQSGAVPVIQLYEESRRQWVYIYLLDRIRPVAQQFPSQVGVLSPHQLSVRIAIADAARQALVFNRLVVRGLHSLGGRSFVAGKESEFTVRLTHNGNARRDYVRWPRASDTGVWSLAVISIAVMRRGGISDDILYLGVRDETGAYKFIWFLPHGYPGGALYSSIDGPAVPIYSRTGGRRDYTPHLIRMAARNRARVFFGRVRIWPTFADSYVYHRESSARFFEEP